MGDNLDTECAGSVLDYSDQNEGHEPIIMKISDIERQLYVVRRGCGDIYILSLEGLGRLYRWQKRTLREHTEDGVDHDK